MRLSAEQMVAIRQSVVGIIGQHACVSVYGSRLDDQARGGDLDLLIEDDELPTLLQKARLKLALEAALSMPVDILAIQRGATPSPFQRIALTGSRPLGEVR